MIFDGLFYEHINFVWDTLLTIEQCLLLVILPVECQVEHTDFVPEILKLGARGIYNAGNFVGNDKLEILNYKHVIRKKKVITWAPYWSQMKRPSLIFTTPIMSSICSLSSSKSCYSY